MANFGLTINGSPDGGIGTGLQTLASAFYKTPEQAATIALAKAHILSQEEYRRKLQQDEADAAAEAQRKDTIFKAQTGAVDPMAAAARGMVPTPAMPVPVEAGPAAPAYGYTGPPPAIVDPVADARYKTDLATHDRLAAANEAMARAGAYGADPGKSLYENAGRGVIASAMADPAIVGGDQQRLASVLATGTLPTETTVLSAGDTSGVRAAAGKDIAVEQAKNAIAANTPVWQDFGNGTGGFVNRATKTVTPAAGVPMPSAAGSDAGAMNRQQLAQLDAKVAGGQKLSPEEQSIHDQLVSAETKANAITLSPDQTAAVAGPSGKFTPAGGQDPASMGPYSRTGSQNDQRVIYQTLNDIADGKPISEAQANAYALSHDAQWGSKWQSVQGRWEEIQSQPPDGVLSPEEVKAIAKGGPRPAVAGPGPAPTVPPEIARLGAGVAAPLVPVGGKLHTPGELIGTPQTQEAQAKYQTFSNMLLPAAIALNKVDQAHLPSISQAAQIAHDTADQATNGSTYSHLFNLATRDVILDPQSRDFEQAVAAWTAPALYDLSGANLTPSEWVRNQIGMVPAYGDSPERLLVKAKQRSVFLQSLVQNGWRGDPENLNKFISNARARGLELGSEPGAEPPVTVGPGAPAPVGAGAPAPAGGGQQTQIPPQPTTGNFAKMSPAEWAAFYNGMSPTSQATYLKNLELQRAK